MLKDSTSNVTVGQFVTTIIENCPETIHSFEQTMQKPNTNDYMLYGYHAGWLEDMDITGKDTPLLKKNAARIAHEFLRLHLHEPDNEDTSTATRLRDIYDCRVCAKHIIQVVAKGIMEGYYITDTLCLFGLNDTITQEESQTIIKRIIHPELRIIL